jgi:hypothetical protein
MSTILRKTTSSKKRSEMTAREINRHDAGEAPAYRLAVPLIDDRQVYYLRKLANIGYGGETPEEVAAMFITEGILKAANSPGLRDVMRRPASWKGFKP